MSFNLSLFPILVFVIFASSCVPEIIDSETGQLIKCPMVSVGNTLTLKISSEAPLPNDLAISLNSENSIAYESCAAPSRVSLSADRREAVVLFNLTGEDEDYYFSNDGSFPLEEYGDFRVYRLEGCGGSKTLLEERFNVAITWLRESNFNEKCNNKSFHGVSQFRHRP